MKTTAFRYHDISAGHRVVGHSGKCQFLHGHNYRITFFCSAEKLDSVGRILDFGDIKAKLCMFLENTWDHHMLLWDKDPMALAISAIDPTVILLPFNPTAENMAAFLLNVVGPEKLKDTGVLLDKVQIDETRKCSVVCELEPPEPTDDGPLEYAKVKPAKWFD